MLFANTRKSILAMLALVLLRCGAVVAQADISSPGQASTNKPCILVYGAVRWPTRLKGQHPIRLAEAIELAGGTTAKASGDVQVINLPSINCDPEQGGQVEQPCKDGRSANTPPPSVRIYKLASLTDHSDDANPFLQTGDAVMVVAQPLVYVTGSVLAPQAMVYVTGMTLTTAITNGGGLLRDSDSRKIHVIRSKPYSFENTEILVDLKKIRKHSTVDLVLEPFDIIDVPSKRWRGHGTGVVCGRLYPQYPVRIVE